MSKLNAITVSVLRNDEAYTFHQVMSELALSVKDSRARSCAENYVKKFDNYRLAIDKSTGNTVATRAREADAARSVAWRGANSYIKAMATYCPVSNQKIAAVPIRSLFEKYGSLLNLSHAEKTSLIENLIESIETVGYDAINAAGFKPWLSDLKKKQSAYKKVVKITVDEVSAKVVGVVRFARVAVDSAFIDFSKIVNAVCLLDGDVNFADFLKKANVIIKKQKTVIKVRKTFAKNKNVETL